MKKKNTKTKVSLSLLSAGMLLLVGCSEEGSSGNNGEDGSAIETIDIMTMSYTPEPPQNDSPVIKELEELTGKKMNMLFVPSTTYGDRFNVTLASGSLPHVMLGDKSPSYISAVRDGAFWDLTDYLDDYENLKINDIVKENVSIEGRIYGIPRARPLGRNAVVIRKDWLENVGMDMPETIDDFYDVLKAFTEDDPDGNGENDTYGMAISEHEEPWNIMQTWFGAPNKWGFDDNGELIPDFTTDEYREALEWFNQIYDEGLINEDFAIMDPTQWTNPMINEEVGIIVDVADTAGRLHKAMVDKDPELDDVLDVFGAVSGDHGLVTKPTTGYHSVFSISTTSVKSEEELKEVLAFLNDLNSEEAQNLTINGIEGVHYELENGELNDLTVDDEKSRNEFQDLNQIQMYLPEEKFHKPEQTDLAIRSQEVMIENEDIVLPDPAYPLVSKIYAQRGQQLDNIIGDARIKYIIGELDDAGFEDAIDTWMSSGGEDYVKEINELYKEAQSVKE
ncbi:extracellular solute-binding protein [Alkalicoccobacillus murimartini]|uniref:Aldouronate transport system substrate-binding protein n=1 Tax=Alkalicoccobacillus murimartini TaxID=171685 RepID=A0ABT9YIG3_9BACI|nr:extracellular solute-binding protein [Alkalicoccobacillus murimartini]MDQ0207652.1 putative aldouronate transport system substrate-binding protein [Alkalicoccobacillus murimartini]